LPARVDRRVGRANTGERYAWLVGQQLLVDSSVSAALVQNHHFGRPALPLVRGRCDRDHTGLADLDSKLFTVKLLISVEIFDLNPQLAYWHTKASFPFSMPQHEALTDTQKYRRRANLSIQRISTVSQFENATSHNTGCAVTHGFLRVRILSRFQEV